MTGKPSAIFKADMKDSLDRLAALPAPKGEKCAVVEATWRRGIIDALWCWCASTEHAKAVAGLAVHQARPTPAEIRDLAAANPWQAPTAAKADCGLCKGTGWQPGYELVAPWGKKWQSFPPGVMTFGQAAAQCVLAENQRIYESARRCPCRKGQ